MKKWSVKSITAIIVLVFILLFVIYSIIGISITGPYYLGRANREQVIKKIEKNEKDSLAITRHAFKYITYTCETDDKFIIYNEKGEKILSRDKKSLQLDEVKKVIQEKYPNLIDEEIQISYGYKNAVYLIEDENYTMLMLDFDKLKEVFYMKEGE